MAVGAVSAMFDLPPPLVSWRMLCNEKAVPGPSRCDPKTRWATYIERIALCAIASLSNGESIRPPRLVLRTWRMFDFTACARYTQTEKSQIG